MPLFVIFWIPLGLVGNYPGLLVLRFLAGSLVLPVSQGALRHMHTWWVLQALVP